MEKTQGVKYPKALATGETTTRQQFLDHLSQPSLFSDDELKAIDKIKELKKSLFSFNTYESIVFDGLCKLCMEAYNGTHSNLLLKLEKGIDEYIDVIERQDSGTETHYRTVLSTEETKAVFCSNLYESYWPYVFDCIKKLAYDPPKKKSLLLGKKLYIDTVPLNIDLIYEDGSSIKKLKTLSGKLTKKQKAAGQKPTPHNEQRKIVGIAIEFYKPLFAPIIELSINKKPGRAYIVTPPYFQLGITDTINNIIKGLTDGTSKIKETTKDRVAKALGNGTLNEQALTLITNTLNSTVTKNMQRRYQTLLGISPLEMRRFYLYLALHDNRKGTYITIENLIDFVESCFPGLVETDRNGSKKIYPSRYKELIDKKLQPMLYIYKQMTIKGNMNGGQLVPLRLTFRDNETGEEFGKQYNNLRIECLKSKNFFSTYTIKDAAHELLELT